MAALAFTGSASAAVSVSDSGTVITVAGTSGDDITTVANDGGASLRVEAATVGAPAGTCTADGTAVVCNRTGRTITANLGGGNDDFENQSTPEANVNGDDGADLLIGRLRSANGGGANDIFRTTGGLTGVVSLNGGDGFDLYDIGANTTASDVISDAGAYMVDYLSRPGATGVTVTANDATANDGGAGEFDNVGPAPYLRGTVNNDNLTGSAGNNDAIDGDLGADTIDGGDDELTVSFAGNTLRADMVVFGFDAIMPYARPAAAARTSGVTVDISSRTNGTSSDGDVLKRVDDVRGTQFDDTITGSSDRDVIEAGGGTGKDTIAAGGDKDIVNCGDLINGVLLLLSGVSSQHGGPTLSLANECTLNVDAGDGDDVVGGGKSADTLRGGGGDDNISGAEGDDLIVGGPGTDSLQGSVGVDTASFAEDPAGVTVNLASGSGEEVSGGNFENVVGSPFNDTITGNDAANRLDGGAGSDTVNYGGRTVRMRIDLKNGTASANGVPEDTIPNFERANGGSADDTIIGTPELNVLVGGEGSDELLPDLGSDVVIGGNGRDQLSFDYLPAGPGAGITHTMGGVAANNSEGDISLEIEELAGSKRDDVLTGTGSNDGLFGGDGNDRLVPLAGRDSLRGGTGTDTLDYSNSAVAIHAHLNQVGGLVVREFAATPTEDSLSDQVENLIGSPFADVLRGSDQHANDIRGGSGNDVIDGRNGDDVLRGDSGSDRFGRVAGSVQETATAAQVSVGNGSTDGADTVFGGFGNDDINVRDGSADTRIDCGAGTDIARQDLVDDDENLDIDNCESIETTAADQLMTAITKVTKSGSRVRAALSCPAKSKVACKGRAGISKTAGGTPRRTTKYNLRKGKKRTVTVRGAGKYLILLEKDQRGDIRRVVKRI